MHPVPWPPGLTLPPDPPIGFEPPNLLHLPNGQKMRAGKYLRRLLPNAQDAEIQYYASLFTLDEFQVTTDYEEALDGCLALSCMGKAHQYEAYNPKLGWALAIRTRSGITLARALVNDKQFVRCYGPGKHNSDPALENWLLAQGYRKARSWLGFRLDPNTEFWPYLDGYYQCVDTDTGEIRTCGPQANQTNGKLGPEEEEEEEEGPACDRCGNSHYELQSVLDADGDYGEWCPHCLRHHATRTTSGEYTTDPAHRLDRLGRIVYTTYANDSELDGLYEVDHTPRTKSLNPTFAPEEDTWEWEGESYHITDMTIYNNCPTPLSQLVVYDKTLYLRTDCTHYSGVWVPTHLTTQVWTYADGNARIKETVPTAILPAGTWIHADGRVFHRLVRHIKIDGWNYLPDEDNPGPPRPCPWSPTLFRKSFETGEFVYANPA